METPDEVTGPVKLANPTEFTIRELAEKVVAMVGGAATYETKPLPVDDPRQRQPDITLARSVLGWEPTTALQDGLRPTIEYFRRHLALDDVGARAAADD